MMQVITLLIALVAPDRLADVALTRTLQNCLSDISSHHRLGLGTHLRVTASCKTKLSDHRSQTQDHVSYSQAWRCICNSNAVAKTTVLKSKSRLVCTYQKQSKVLRTE